MKGLETTEDVAIARIIAAAVALHGLIASGVKSEEDDRAKVRQKLVDESFAIADLFIARAEKEAPP